LARGLHSTILDDLGLETAIRRYTDEFSQTHGIRVDVEFGDVQLSSFANHEQLNLYRIVQEALTNVARHAHAKKVSISFETDQSGLHVTVQDDGRGFSPGAATDSSHLGIEGMRQRATMIGGTLNVIPQAHGGVTVDLLVPPKQGSRLMEATP
jgi:signal transduction histidine kinase